MKLNPDCIRAILLEIENSWEITATSDGILKMGNLSIEAIYNALPDYDKKDIFYSLYNLEQAGYVNMDVFWADGGVYHCSINYMTYDGHKFLDSVRDSKRWAGVKKGLEAVRNYSLDVIASIAEGITSAAISKYLESN